MTQTLSVSLMSNTYGRSCGGRKTQDSDFGVGGDLHTGPSGAADRTCGSPRILAVGDRQPERRRDLAPDRTSRGYGGDRAGCPCWRADRLEPPERVRDLCGMALALCSRHYAQYRACLWNACTRAVAGDAVAARAHRLRLAVL